MTERCPDCGRRKAHGGEDWSVSYNSARRDEVADLCGKHLPSYWSDEAIPDCEDATIAHQKEQLAAARKCIEAADKLVAISDRKHDFWDAYHAARADYDRAMAAAKET